MKKLLLIALITSLVVSAFTVLIEQNRFLREELGPYKKFYDNYSGIVQEKDYYRNSYQGVLHKKHALESNLNKMQEMMQWSNKISATGGRKMFSVLGNPSKQQKLWLSEALNKIESKELIRCLDYVVFQESRKLDPNTAGFTEFLRHPHSMCLNKRLKTGNLKSVVWHEIAHLRTEDLALTKFLDAWKSSMDEGKESEVLKLKTGGVYFWLSWKDNGGTEPRNGYVHPYGATDPWEDIATFNEETYNLLNGLPSALSQAPNDERYKRKLTLLFWNGFITSDQYEKVWKLLDWRWPE